MRVKRLIDLMGAVVSLLLLSPVFILIGLVIKLTSSGPVLHRAQRGGLKGAPFTLYKFRSMVIDAHELGPAITAQDDLRVTRIGKFLRRTKLDELPQLLNVLKGDMSLVGPRPEDLRYVALYTPEQRRVLSILPGMTSQASIYYRREEELLLTDSSDETYRSVILPQKLAMDLAYVDHRSIWLDFKILAQTVLALFR